MATPPPASTPWKGTVVACLLGLAGGLAVWSGGIAREQEDFWAQRVAATANPAPARDPGLVHIVLDDLTDEPWPWPHLDYAILLHAVSTYEPEVVGLQWPLHHRDASQDVYERQLARQMKSFRGVVLAAPVLAASPDAGPSTAADALPVEGDSSHLPVSGGALWPLPAYLAGHDAAPLTAESGNPERAPLVVLHNGRALPTFPLAVYGKWLGAYWPHSSLRPGGDLILRDFQKRPLARIPVDRDGALRLLPRSRLPAVPRVEFYTAVLSAEQMHNGQKPLFDLNRLRHNILLATLAHPATGEAASSGAYPGDLAARTLLQLLARHHWKPCPTWAALLMLAAATLLMAWAGALPNPLLATGGWIAGLFLGVADTWFFLRFFDLQLPLAAALAGGTLAWAASFAWHSLPASSSPSSPAATTTHGKDSSPQDSRSPDGTRPSPPFSASSSAPTT